MCDGWTSISRPQPFSQSALLLWASDALRHPGCSPQFTCLCVKISGRVGLNPSRETDLENTGGHTSRWVPPQMSASWTLTSHIRNITTRCFTLEQTMWHHFSSPPPPSLPLSHCQSLYWHCSFIGAHLSMKGFILAANHSRGVVIKYRCANILTTLMSSAGGIWSKTWKFKYTQEKNVFIEAEVLHFHYHWNRYKRKRHSINWIKSCDITQ